METLRRLWARLGRWACKKGLHRWQCQGVKPIWPAPGWPYSGTTVLYRCARPGCLWERFVETKGHQG